jgi:hypothetical protein
VGLADLRVLLIGVLFVVGEALDFVKVGVPFKLVALIVTILLVPILLPFTI